MEFLDTLFETLGALTIPFFAALFLFIVGVISVLMNKTLNGGSKAVWVIAFIVPFITPLIYWFSYKRRAMLVAIILTALGLIAFYGMKIYLKNQPHRDVTKEKGIGVTAEKIFTDFTTNEAVANQTYLNKAIEVSGEVAEVKKNQDSNTVVVLKTSDPVFGVNCTFKEDPGQLQPGNNITFKGICTGFISDVVINEGVLLKK